MLLRLAEGSAPVLLRARCVEGITMRRPLVSWGGVAGDACRPCCTYVLGQVQNIYCVGDLVHQGKDAHDVPLVVTASSSGVGDLVHQGKDAQWHVYSMCERPCASGAGCTRRSTCCDSLFFRCGRPCASGEGCT